MLLTMMKDQGAGTKLPRKFEIKYDKIAKSTMQETSCNILFHKMVLAGSSSADQISS
jgi:hypothetical protein